MCWLPSRAHDNGMFLIFSNGGGIDDDEVRTGNAIILDPYGEILVETRKADDDMVIAEGGFLGGREASFLSLSDCRSRPR